MNDKTLPLKLLANDWNMVKSKYGLENLGLLRCMGSLKEENLIPKKSHGFKTNQNALDKRECEKSEMALQHKSKLCIYKEVKQEVGFEEYLEYVKGANSKCVILLDTKLLSRWSS